METIWPRSSSPCAGVLQLRLASNASAKLFASAASLDWVMENDYAFRDVRREIWGAYITRSRGIACKSPTHRNVTLFLVLRCPFFVAHLSNNEQRRTKNE